MGVYGLLGRAAPPAARFVAGGGHGSELQRGTEPVHRFNDSVSFFIIINGAHMWFPHGFII